MRLFIAIPLPQAAEQYLAGIIRTLRKSDDGIKWVEPHNIHLTLRFLGETSENLVPLIQTEMLGVVGAVHVFECNFGAVGAFPNLIRPRAIWIGLDGGMDVLTRAASQLEMRMHSIGFAPEVKPFKPHLTLGRMRDGAPPITIKTDAISLIKPAEPVCLDRMILYQSTLTPQGPIYKPLFTAEFGAQ